MLGWLCACICKSGTRSREALQWCRDDLTVSVFQEDFFVPPLASCCAMMNSRMSLAVRQGLSITTECPQLSSRSTLHPGNTSPMTLAPETSITWTNTGGLFYHHDATLRLLFLAVLGFGPHIGRVMLLLWCGVWMFSVVLKKGFHQVPMISSHTTCMFGLIGDSKLPIGASERLNGVSVCVLWWIGDLSMVYFLHSLRWAWADQWLSVLLDRRRKVLLPRLSNSLDKDELKVWESPETSSQIIYTSLMLQGFAVAYLNIHGDKSPVHQGAHTNTLEQ